MDIPKPVIDYFGNFQRYINEKKPNEIQHAYDEFPSFVDAFFPNQLLPPVELFEKHIEIIGIFELLYDQLRFKLLFMRRKATYEEFHESFFMHHKLFGYLLKDENTRQMFLPKQWIWDILESFTYQFLEFIKFQKLAEERNEPIPANPNKPIWKPAFVFQMLSDFIMASKFSKSPYYQMIRLFGIYSTIQNLKLNTIFGDFYQALKCLEEMELESATVLVYDCKATYLFYGAFAALCAREYATCARLSILLLNALYKRDLTLSYEFTLQHKNLEAKCKAMLAVCTTLLPITLDETTSAHLRDPMLAECFNSMYKGDVTAYMACFNEVYIDMLQYTLDGQKSLIASTFAEEMKQSASLAVLRNVTKLYTTLPLAKLAHLVSTIGNVKYTEHDITTLLLLYKQKSREMRETLVSVTLSAANSPDLSTNILGQDDALGGPYMNFPSLGTSSVTLALLSQLIPDAEIAITFVSNNEKTNESKQPNQAILVVSDGKVERKIGEYFLKQTLRFDEINRNLRRIKYAA